MGESNKNDAIDMRYVCTAKGMLKSFPGFVLIYARLQPVAGLLALSIPAFPNATHSPRWMIISAVVVTTGTFMAIYRNK